MVLKIKEALQEAVYNAVQEAMQQGLLPQGQLPAILFEVPPQKDFGDFASNFAMQAAKSLRSNPKAIAQIIKDKIKCPFLQKIDIAGPGFMNFYLKTDWLYELLSSIVEKGRQYGNLPAINDGQKIMIEYVSANPTGPLHIGHGRGAAFGSSLVNLLKVAGFDVSAEYYINDAGNQINNLAASVNARYLELLNRPFEFPEDGYHGQDIVQTAQSIIEQYGDKFLALSTKDRLETFKELALKEKIALLKKDLQLFNVNFDTWFSEQSLHDDNEIEKCCDDLLKKGFMYEKDGAKWLKSVDYGDDKDRVVIRENGVPTYFAADIAYHKNKFSRGFTDLIDIWGADHHGYIKRMQAACEVLGYKGSQLEVLILQMVNLFKDGEVVKMSKRTGKSITLNELIEEVGADAARFFFVMRSIDSQLDFDLNLAVEKSNENPVYYIQYAHARICSIFRQMKELNIERTENANLTLLQEESEIELIKKLGEYEQELQKAAQDRAVHKVARYVHDLAGLFHSFYNQCRIIGADKDLQQARLTLILAVKNCLCHALDILGISKPEHM